MKIADCQLGFIGFGHMAQVLFQSIDNARLIPRSNLRFVQRDPSRTKKNAQKYGITAATLKTLVQKSDLLLLGVRPNQAELVLRDLALLGVQNKWVISILAGVRISFFEKYLGPETQLLRVMPNLASAVGEGMSILTFSKHASREFQAAARALFLASGEIAELPEELTDLACGMTGSGPGFVFRLIEAEARLGEKAGIPYPQALKMAAQTFAGAARLILKGALPEQLLTQIAVPGGTTEAGFRVMKETQMEKHFQATIEAAAQRSKEISGYSPNKEG